MKTTFDTLKSSTESAESIQYFLIGDTVVLYVFAALFCGIIPVDTVSSILAQRNTITVRRSFHTWSQFQSPLIPFFSKPLQVSAAFHTGSKFPSSEKAAFIFFALVSNFAETKIEKAVLLTNQINVGKLMMSHQNSSGCISPSLTERFFICSLSPSANVEPIDSFLLTDGYSKILRSNQN